MVNEAECVENRKEDDKLIKVLLAIATTNKKNNR